MTLRLQKKGCLWIRCFTFWFQQVFFWNRHLRIWKKVFNPFPKCGVLSCVFADSESAFPHIPNTCQPPPPILLCITCHPRFFALTCFTACVFLHHITLELHLKTSVELYFGKHRFEKCRGVRLVKKNFSFFKPPHLHVHALKRVERCQGPVFSKRELCDTVQA